MDLLLTAMSQLGTGGSKVLAAMRSHLHDAAFGPKPEPTVTEIRANRAAFLDRMRGAGLMGTN